MGYGCVCGSHRKIRLTQLWVELSWVVAMTHSPCMDNPACPCEVCDHNSGPRSTKVAHQLLSHSRRREGRKSYVVGRDRDNI